MIKCQGDWYYERDYEVELEYAEFRISGRSKDISNFIDELETKGRDLSLKLEITKFTETNHTKVECWIEMEFIDKLSELVENLVGDNNLKLGVENFENDGEF